MSPDDIAEVTSRWRLATSEPQLLHLAIAERLTGPLRFRNRRADWIIEAVTCLSGVLAHPGAFASTAADLLDRRPHVTVDELASEREALLAAVADLCGPFDGTALHSWTLAIGLFAEITAANGLHPFSRDGDVGPIRG
jgi:hypothetical protein